MKRKSPLLVMNFRVRGIPGGARPVGNDDPFLTRDAVDQEDLPALGLPMMATRMYSRLPRLPLLLQEEQIQKWRPADRLFRVA